jgi:hypothetical protein
VVGAMLTGVRVVCDASCSYSATAYTVHLYSGFCIMDNAEEFFLERAAIMQYDAGMLRMDAELAALCLTRRWCDRHGIDHPELGYFYALRIAVIEWDEQQGRAFYVGPNNTWQTN